MSEILFARFDELPSFNNPTFTGAIQIATAGGRVSITNASTPLATVGAFVDIVNNATTSGAGNANVRMLSYWQGTTATPYQNNDNLLSEVYNDVLSNSLNRSWAGSFSNSFNKIPLGVTDTGTRVGVLGWAVSTNTGTGYVHLGTLTSQIGLHGTAGFQGLGSGTAAIITNATAVRGQVLAESVGSTITNARAGEFISYSTVGVIQNNIAVYAEASTGTISNYSFYGQSGKMFNSDQALFGNGTVGLPAYAFSQDPFSGLYSIAASNLGVAINAVKILDIKSTGLGVTGALTATSFNGLTLTTSTGALTVANGKTATINSTLQFSGTDGSTVAFGAGGTLGSVAYSALGQIAATATNDDAAAGKSGEVISSALGAGGALSISPSGTTINVTSISLTAGDWDITGMVGWNGGATTTVTLFSAGISSTSATLPASSDLYSHPFSASYTPFATAVFSASVPKIRKSLATTTTVYLTAACSFGVSTCTAYGKIEARRVR